MYDALKLGASLIAFRAQVPLKMEALMVSVEKEQRLVLRFQK